MITRRHTASKETGDVPMTDEFVGALAADPAVAATASGAPAAAAAAAASYRIRIDSPTAHFDKILHQSAICRRSNKNSL